MRDLEGARLMLRLARRDMKAMQALLDPEATDPETFGFHAQQATEKAAKAWLALTGVVYPKTHDLEALFGLLDEQGEQVPQPLRDLAYLTSFAVDFRYSVSGDYQQDLDRPLLIRQVEAVLAQVEMLAEASDARP